MRDVSSLQSDDVETWSEWTARTNDHGVRLNWSSLSGGRNEGDGNRVTAGGASRGRRLGRSALQIALRNEESSAQLGEEERERESVLIEMNFEIETLSPAIVRCRERDVC